LLELDEQEKTSLPGLVSRSVEFGSLSVTPKIVQKPLLTFT